MKDSSPYMPTTNESRNWDVSTCIDLNTTKILQCFEEKIMEKLSEDPEMDITYAFNDLIEKFRIMPVTLVGKWEAVHLDIINSEQRKDMKKSYEKSY